MMHLLGNPMIEEANTIIPRPMGHVGIGDIILCVHPGHEGMWVPTRQHWHSRDSQRVVEIACGRIAHMLGHDEGPANILQTWCELGKHGVKFADPPKWCFMMGLVACGLATRIQV
jgi:hypothetical protein